MEYTTPHTPQPNGVVEKRFYIIKEGALEILLNAKIYDTAQKMLWAEAVHSFEQIRNSISTTGSTTSPFKTFY